MTTCVITNRTISTTPVEVIPGIREIATAETSTQDVENILVVGEIARNSNLPNAARATTPDTLYVTAPSVSASHAVTRDMIGGTESAPSTND